MMEFEKVLSGLAVAVVVIKVVACKREVIVFELMELMLFNCLNIIRKSWIRFVYKEGTRKGGGSRHEILSKKIRFDALVGTSVHILPAETCPPMYTAFVISHGSPSNKPRKIGLSSAGRRPVSLCGCLGYILPASIPKNLIPNKFNLQRMFI